MPQIPVAIGDIVLSADHRFELVKSLEHRHMFALQRIFDGWAFKKEYVSQYVNTLLRTAEMIRMLEPNHDFHRSIAFLDNGTALLTCDVKSLFQWPPYE
jgi:hypothetical protein